MRIGIASEWIGQRVGGSERYAVNLIEHLLRLDERNRYRIFLTPGGKKQLAERNGARNSRATLHATLSDSRWYYVPFGLPWNALVHPVDVLHATFTVAPWCPGRRIVLTVHDVCPDVHPDYFVPSVRTRVRWLLARGLKRAHRVLVPTEATRTELLEHYPVEPGKLRVIPYGVDRRFATSAGREPDDVNLEGRPLPDEFILYVGRFHGRKNLERLLDAVAILRRRPGRENVRLILVGRDFWHRKNVMSKIVELGLKGDVLCPGHVSDASLELLYRKARVFAFPSVHEGFGIPPLEAMARGVPVLAANLSAMPEVLGHDALLVDPYRPEAIAEGLDRLITDESLRKDLIRRGRERAERFTWETTARKTLAVYEELVNDRK